MVPAHPSLAGKPLFLKQSLLLFPAIYVAYFYFGYPHEYRVFFDMHGPLMLLASHTLISATGIARSVDPALNRIITGAT